MVKTSGNSLVSGQNNAGFDFSAALAALSGRGLYADEIITDGEIHRVKAEGKKGNKNGWYVYFQVSDKYHIAVFGNWATGEKHTWTSRKRLSSEEKLTFKRIVAEAKKKRQRALEQQYEIAQKRAVSIWNRCTPANSHPYADRKGIPLLGDVRISRFGALVIPAYDFDGNIRTLQFIPADPGKKKLFLKKGKKSGCHAVIPGNGETVYFAEGYATAISVHMATGGTVIIAFDAGNLGPALSEFRKKYHDKNVVICGDNDLWTRMQDGTLYNPGKDKATKAGIEHRAKVALPDFYQCLPDRIIDTEKPTDFNDLHTLAGIAEVKKQIAAARDVKKFSTSDLGNAERLHYEHGHNIRQCEESGKWHFYESGKWAEKEKDNEVRQLGFSMMKEISAELKKIAQGLDEREYEKAKRYAESFESKSKISAMLDLFRSLPGVPVNINSLDKDRYLFNAKNCTIDLRTGKPAQHNRAHLITKQSPVAYDPDAKCPLWMKFLSRVMDNDRESISFLQRFIGYCLTGDTSEESMVILYGTGQNGKSKFVGAIRDLLADYARSTPFSTFTTNKKSEIPNDLASLKGARFVEASEPDAGVRLSESVIKISTGNDMISARFLYGEFFDFYPQFKLCLVTNHKPVIYGQDFGIWRRVNLVPFSVTIPPEERDKNLSEKLKAELPGILNWAIAGCLEWQKQGLNPPEKISAATADYKEEMDTLSGFFADCCIIHADMKAGIGDLYKAYGQWCEDNSEKPAKKRTFTSMMAERKFTQGKIKSFRFWRGIGLLYSEGGQNGGQNFVPQGQMENSFVPHDDIDITDNYSRGDKGDKKNA